MKKIIGLSIAFMVLAGFSLAIQSPEPPIDNNLIEEPDLPDTDFESSFDYGYESSLVNFSSSEDIENDWVVNRTTPDQNVSDNSTAENETEEDVADEPSKDTSDSESGESYGSSGDVDYVDVEISDGVDNTTAPTDNSEKQKSKQNASEPDKDNETKVTRPQRDIFDGPWSETASKSGGMFENITGQFSESNTIGGAFLLVFAGLAAFAYF